MLRSLFHLRLNAGAEDSFDERAARPSSDLTDGLRAARLSNVSAFRRGPDEWCYAEAPSETSGIAEGDPSLDRLVGAAAWNRWMAGLGDVVMQAPEPGGLTRYREVFHSDGPPLPTTVERGMFVLVVHPERIAEYEARHADVWSEMMAALAESGFRNYTGFRRDSQVAYYGEFHPDMPRALAAIAATDVNRRWGASFEGIITSISDREGRLFTAREVFHLD
jgi:L-rhamnose mutarotase